MNNQFFQIIPKKSLLLILFLIISIGILSIISLLSPRTNSVPVSPRPVIMQSPAPINNVLPLQKTVTGKTPTQEIEKNFNILNKQPLENNKISYTIASPLNARPDQILTQNNLAIFERVVVVGRQEETNKISSIITRFGPAEKIFKGSKYYGDHMSTYVYASKGFTIIGNDNADEIYEIQTFIPTSVENYLKNYGEDILLDASTFKGE